MPDQLAAVIAERAGRTSWSLRWPRIRCPPNLVDTERAAAPYDEAVLA